MSNSSWKVNIFNHLLIIFEIILDTCTFICMSNMSKTQNVSCLVTLTLRGRLYRRRYQLVFFKTSAKDIKNTPSILVVQISVIHQLKLWSVYFFCVHSRIQQNFVVLEKKKKTNRMRSLSSPSPRAALQKTSLKWTVTQRKLNTRTWELYL